MAVIKKQVAGFTIRFFIFVKEKHILVGLVRNIVGIIRFSKRPNIFEEAGLLAYLYHNSPCYRPFRK